MKQKKKRKRKTKKRVKVKHMDELIRALEEPGDKSDDFKELAVKAIELLGSVEKASEFSRVPEATLYKWMKEWNKKKEEALKITEEREEEEKVN